MSNSSIMSVREMIDSAFGEREANTIHFKLIQTILFILARQLRLLERRVSLVAPMLVPSESSLSIREVKIKAHVKKKKRIQSPSSKGFVKKVLLKSSSTKTQPSAVKSISGQSTTLKSKLSPEQTTTSSTKTSSDPTKTSSSKTTSDPTKTSTSKTTSEPTESSSSKTTSDPTKTSSSKTTSDPTQSSSSKTTSDPTKTSSSKTTSDPTQSSSSKSTSDPTKSSSSKTTSDPTQSSSSKTTSDPTKSSSSKTTSDPTQSSSSKTTSDPTKSSSDKTTSDPTQSSSSKTTSDPTQSSSSKTTSDPTQSSSSKTTSDPTKTTTSTKSSTDPSSSLKTSTEKSSSSRTKSTSKSTSSEDKRKKRADSHEEGIETPAPMASIDAMEVQYEKLLVVERVPSDEAKARGRGRQRKSSEISVVTQGQFEELATAVREIQQKFGATGKADFLENAELMQELRRGASLTDAMAALQLSARLEAAEKTLQHMISLVTDLAARKGVNLDFTDDQMLETQTEQVSEKPSYTTTKSSKSSKSGKSGKSREPSTRPSMVMISTTTMPLPESTVDEQETLPPISAEEAIEIELKQSKLKQNLITSEDLENALKELTDGILKAVGNITTKTVSNAEQAYKTASKIEGKLNKALDLGDRMDELESIVSKYVEQINIMDTNLSSQMTNYQEQLTQMQHDLESGLETMAESMANSGGDTLAVAELNAHFTDLQVDFDNTHTKQKELQEYQDSIALDLQGLLKQIEILRETKSDRDEVADALRDKAGLGALNGLVTLQQFNAVRGDFEKRIGAAYDKFNNQEIIWQKAIDDLLRELHEKADIVQVMSLRDDIQNNLDKLGNRIRSMLDIVGEPRSAAVSRKLFRDSNCLSCSTPANMNIEEVNKIPIIPAFKSSKRPPTIGAEDESKPKESGDYICYPGQPVRHPIDERAHICRRYCGGSHTMVPASTLTRGPTGMIITNMPHSTSTALGTDGKVYQVDENVKKPCVPCNKSKSYMKMPEPSEADTAPREGSDMMPWDYQQFAQTEGNVDVTPPPPSEGFD
ncbi:serine-rich adhesin for platelets-like isoform X2 [Pieris napi]|uniref:serine-rich adhesin for platelets-like isoform X2 n=1 Tax=Pieris napi TaxID=78633 RepID=UPI001FB98AB4|nr:serine-rich adhesin for platelets-like isoform X2 [Pieris napi]